VPGIDAFFIGPYDLSGSMGLMGQVHHPDVDAALACVLEAAQAANIAPGLHIVDPQPGEIEQRQREGFRFIAVGMDTLMLVNTARSMISLQT
jgi:2-dehydro-3-deoxyglucarate aldolase